MLSRYPNRKPMYDNYKRTIMNKNIYLLLLTCLLSGLLGACKEDKLMDYEGADNIFFYSAFSPVNFADTLSMPLVYFPTITDTIVPLPVAFTGLIKDFDRPYKLVVDPSSTAREGIDYKLIGNYTIPANQYQDTVFLQMFRLDDDSVHELILRLEANDYFAADFVQHKYMGSGKFAGYVSQSTRFKVLLSNDLQQPRNWSSDYFGPWSKKKHLLMCVVCEIPASELQRADLTTTEARYYGNRMRIYLEKEKSEERTVYEADGTEMTMGGGL